MNIRPNSKYLSFFRIFKLYTGFFCITFFWIYVKSLLVGVLKNMKVSKTKFLDTNQYINQYFWRASRK